MNAINSIVRLMMEQIPAPGMGSNTSGVSPQSAMNVLPGQAAATGFEMNLDDDDEGSGYQPEQVAAARDFIAMVGSAEVARELIDKVEEAMGVFDDGGGDDTDTIDLVASLIPEVPDMPMQKNITRISSMFDPSARTH